MLFNSTGGSVLVVVVLHAASNAMCVLPDDLVGDTVATRQP